MRRRSSSGIIFLLIAFLTSGTGGYLFLNSQKSMKKKGNPIGFVIHLTGAPLIRNEGEPFWRKITLNEHVYGRQKIRTSALETVTIKTNQGELIRVAENSTVTLQNRKNESPVKINIGNIDVFNTKDQKSLQQTFETIVKDSQKLQQKNEYLLTSKGQKINLKRDELKIDKPEPEATVLIPDSANKEINLLWKGSPENAYEIQVSLNGRPAKRYFTKTLQHAISVQEEPTSGYVTWRVKDRSSGKSTEWHRFKYVVINTPIITQPSNGSNIYFTQDRKSLFEVLLNSAYQKHEIEIQSNNQTNVITVNERRGVISKAQLQINSESRNQPVVLRARSEFSQGQWTNWSNPIQVTLVNLTKLKTLAPSSKVSRLICENGQWHCQSPLQFPIPHERSSSLMYSSRWYFSTNPNQSYLMPVIQKGNNMLTCAPFPHTQWRLKIVETNLKTFEQFESDEIKVRAISSTPPNPILDKAFVVSDNEIAIEFPTCPHTLMKTTFENSDLSKETIITTSGPIISKLAIKRPEVSQTQFLDLNQNPISNLTEKFKLKPINQMSMTNATNQNDKTEQPETIIRPPNYTQWILADAAKIYVNDSEGKAWTPISWRSKPEWPNYEYQISLDSNFSNIIESNIQSQSSIRVLIPDKFNFIYWRVRGIGESSQSDWSRTRKVEINRLRKTIESKISEELVK